MYEPLLLVHSWMRWAVVGTMLFFFGRALVGWVRGSRWSDADTRFVWAFEQLFGWQILFGLTMWAAFSPYVKAGFADPKHIFENPVVFFWTLQHGLTMILAMVLLQIGKFQASKMAVQIRFKVYSFIFGLLILVLGSAIPWPGLVYGRNLFRGVF